jgi:hypothetical protein
MIPAMIPAYMKIEANNMGMLIYDSFFYGKLAVVMVGF